MLYLLKISNLFKLLFGQIGNVSTYGVLKPCYRCRYAKTYEPILIFSRDRGPRIIVNLDKNTYVRHNDCLGYSKCQKCFEVASNPNKSKLPCTWIKL